MSDWHEDTPLLSVSILAYNYEDRIAKAIESVLVQAVNFPIEIIIGDDHSRDKTTDIIKKYEAAHPGKIFGIYHPRKYDEIPGRINNVTNLSACRGKYIAMLDGDDYWTYAYKLQEQVDFLEKHPDFHICFHDVEMKFEEQPEKNGLYSEIHPALRNLLQKKEGTEFKFRDILSYGGSCMATSSMVFLASKIKPLPEWFFEVAAADYSLQLLAAEGAKIKFFPSVWGVYVRHGGAISSGYFRSVKNLENKLNELDIYKDRFRDYYKPSFFSKLRSNILFRLGKRYMQKGRWFAGLMSLLKSVWADPRQSVIRVKEKFTGIFMK